MRNTFGDLIEALATFVMKSAGVNIKNEQKKLHINLKTNQLKVGKMLRLMIKSGILKVHHHIHLIKSLERQVDLQKLLEMIPLAMHRKVFCMAKVKTKSLVAG